MLPPPLLPAPCPLPHAHPQPALPCPALPPPPPRLRFELLARLQLPAPERWGEAVLAVRFLPSALVGLESLSAYRANLQVSWGPACQASFASFCQPAASRVGARSPDTAPLEQSSYLTTCPFLHMCWPPRCSWVPIQVPPLMLA